MRIRIARLTPRTSGMPLTPQTFSLDATHRSAAEAALRFGARSLDQVFRE
jgi:hypothetical protein